MSLLEDWRKKAYLNNQDKYATDKLWNDYFEVEKGIYKKLLADVTKVEKGTVAQLAEKYGTDIQTMTGFLDGIDDSLRTKNPIDTMEEDTEVALDIDPELLYKNMVGAKADWLYELPEWDSILPEDRRRELMREQRKSGTIVKDKKIGRNDPCPCGSGKKYKYCCGRNA